MSKKVVAVALVLGLGAWGAQAQSTVKELLDKGGKKMSAADLKALASGATLTGVSPQPNNKSFTFAFDLAPTGELTGNGWTTEWMAPVKGRWSINKVGQFCTHLATAAADDKGNCANFYNLDKAYYATVANEKGEAEPDAPLMWREFTRLAKNAAAPAPTTAATAPKAP